MARWFQRRDRVGTPIRWWRAEVARRQISIVRKRVEVELYRQRLGVNQKVAGPDDFEGIRQLELRLAAIDNSLDELNRYPVKKIRALDRMVVRLWDWAVRGKFDFEEETRAMKRRRR